jgi:DNA invertase Pin-like site-specific DNA recombinase
MRKESRRKVIVFFFYSSSWKREMIRKRQAEGIEAAKQKGKKLGRPALTFPENWDAVYAEWTAGKITAKRAMELTHTKRTSFYKLVNQIK